MPSAPEVEYIPDDLGEEQMAALYRACDYLVQPFRGEGFCLPISEAMACGLPAIVTGYGPLLDYCTDETTYLVPCRIDRFKENRGVYLEKASRLDEAQRQWRPALADQPRFLPALRSLGDLAMKRRDWAALEEITDRPQSVPRAAAEGDVLRARGYLARQEYPAALDSQPGFGHRRQECRAGLAVGIAIPRSRMSVARKTRLKRPVSFQLVSPCFSLFHLVSACFTLFQSISTSKTGVGG